MTPKQAHRKELYWLGYRHGQRLAATHENHEQALRLEIQLTDGGPHRAFALGELRGYRDAQWNA